MTVNHTRGRPAFSARRGETQAAAPGRRHSPGFFDAQGKRQNTGQWVRRVASVSARTEQDLEVWNLEALNPAALIRRRDTLRDHLVTLRALGRLFAQRGNASHARRVPFEAAASCAPREDQKKHRVGGRGSPAFSLRKGKTVRPFRHTGDAHLPK